jgi:hypothetical protein
MFCPVRRRWDAILAHHETAMLFAISIGTTVSPVRWDHLAGVVSGAVVILTEGGRAVICG